MVGLVTEGNRVYAGKHLLLDLFDCRNHGDMGEIERVMVEACEATGATVLFSHLHPFDGGGTSGAIILAESHMSIHTWPENGLVTLDIFVCGSCDPHKAIPLLTQHFQPGKSKISMRKRGRMEVCD